MSEPQTMTPLELKAKVQILRSAYQHGQASYEKLERAANEYRDSLIAGKKAKRYRGPIPSVAYIIRAV